MWDTLKYYANFLIPAPAPTRERVSKKDIYGKCDHGRHVKENGWYDSQVCMDCDECLDGTMNTA